MASQGVPYIGDKPNVRNSSVLKWIDSCIQLCQPRDVRWINGSEQEADELFATMVAQKKAIKLNPKLRPGCYLFRSNPADVARVESRTFICSSKKIDAGPTNNWEEPKKMKAHLLNLFKGCMRGRTMYIVPFTMGIENSQFAVVGIQITDTPYAVVNVRIMARVSLRAVESLKEDDRWVPGLHSVGHPLPNGAPDVPWPCNPDKTVIAHFPEELSIYSFGSGYGGNALLGKKCLALRIASVLGRNEGWLAEHMLILGCESPSGEKTYVTGAFPSQCGKTNFAMMEFPEAMKGWKITTIADDIAWIRPNKKSGYLHAVNAEFGFFGVAPGTSDLTNPRAMELTRKNTIFTNVALTEDGDVWWEGMTDVPPARLIDWKGNPWTPKSKTLAAHPNSRFTSPLVNCTCLDEKWNDPEGVPIKAMIFGGRRMHDIPLVYQAFEWAHGMYLAATLCSETTAAAEGAVGSLRNDPYAMLPFAGYHMGDLFQHHLELGKQVEHLPRVFHVNWFRKDAKGRYLWPGFGENARVLKWIVGRVGGQSFGLETPLGWVPRYQDMDWRGLPYPKEQWDELMHVDKQRILDISMNAEKLFLMLHERIPRALLAERSLLISRL